MLINSVEIIKEIMDEMGWVYLPEWEANARKIHLVYNLLFEKRSSKIRGAVEIEPGIYIVPQGCPPKRFIVIDRTVSWETSNGVKTVDLAEPGSLEEIVSYVSE